MKKTLLSIIAFVLVLSVAGFVFFMQNKNPNSDIPENIDSQETDIPVVDNFGFSDCPTACDHYVESCLTLEEETTSESLEKGRAFCLAECQKWDINKVNCVAHAIDCEAMANYCGL